jgi:hypothetical protein
VTARLDTVSSCLCPVVGRPSTVVCCFRPIGRRPVPISLRAQKSILETYSRVVIEIVQPGQLITAARSRRSAVSSRAAAVSSRSVETR